MGTNYYLRSEPCSHCGRADENMHIGKSSGGWCFALHVIPERGINNLGDWLTKFHDGSKIVNEYGESISQEEMHGIITCRGRDDAVTGFDYRSNYAQPGPNNLVRYVIDGKRCIGHGEGTWDLIAGEFS